MATVQDGFKLEVAFASGPFDPAPSWTDITQYWRLSSTTSIDHGRSSENDQVSTGMLSLTLDNTDGRFTVGNTSSPYYPNVKLRKQIRITYTQTAVTYPIFKGHVDEWPVEWPDGGELYAWAQVRAVDRFKPIGSPRTLRSVPEEELLLPVPQVYYPLGEDDGATAAGDISGNSRTAFQQQYGDGGTLAFAQATGPGTDGLSAPVWTANTTFDGGVVLVDPGVVGAGAGLSVVFTFLAASDPGVNIYPVTIGKDNLEPYLEFQPDGSLSSFSVADSNGVSAGNTFGGNYLDGATHVAALTLTPNVAGATLRCYVDGTLKGTGTTTGAMTEFLSAALPTFNGLTIGGKKDYSAPGMFGVWSGTISHVAVYGSVLDATTVARQSDALLTGFANESTGARAARVADWCGITSGDRTIDTGQTTSIRHVDTTGKTGQGFLQELADTEGGLVFMDTAGKLQFQDRATRINTTAALTLNASSQQVSPDVTYRANDQFLVNDITYFREGGIRYRATDATSISDNGPAAPGERETYTTSDAEVRDHATWVIYTSKTPIARIEGLGVDMLTDSASRIAAVQLDLSSKVTVTNMPGAAPGSSTSVFVEGWRESISATEWTRELYTSPADQYSPLWALGVAGFSELGQTTTLNF